MATPYIGEIKLWAFSWAPVDWAICDGSILSITENTALFALIGTKFGGNGRTNFALPDLRGRIVLGLGDGYQIGDRGGLETVSLASTQIPIHTHGVNVNSGNGDKFFPFNSDEFLSASASTPEFFTTSVSNIVNLSSDVIATSTGGSQSHNNIQPSIVANYCISLKGIFPSRN